jgi:hypothetical protein
MLIFILYKNVQLRGNVHLRWRTEAPAYGDRRSTIHDPRSTIHDPRSTIHDPRSTIHDPRSAVHDPRSTIPNRFQVSPRDSARGVSLGPSVPTPALHHTAINPQTSPSIDRRSVARRFGPPLEAKKRSGPAGRSVVDFL